VQNITTASASVSTKEHMPEIKKIDAKIAVESKLADVTKALAALDKLTTRAELLELELSQLRAQEAEILKDETKSDESKLPNLLGVRGKIDLKSAAIASLRGTPSAGNNIAAVKGKIDIASEEVQRIGEIVSQLFKAWNDSNLLAFQAHTIEATKFFVKEEDRPVLEQLRDRHSLYREMKAFSPPYFGKHHQHGYADSVINARNLEVIWDQLQTNAGIYPDLEVSVHDAWIE
jgi:hypothetical protein